MDREISAKLLTAGILRRLLRETRGATFRAATSIWAYVAIFLLVTYFLVQQLSTMC